MTASDGDLRATPEHPAAWLTKSKLPWPAGLNTFGKQTRFLVKHPEIRTRPGRRKGREKELEYSTLDFVSALGSLPKKILDLEQPTDDQFIEDQIIEALIDGLSSLQKNQHGEALRLVTQCRTILLQLRELRG